MTTAIRPKLFIDSIVDKFIPEENGGDPAYVATQRHKLRNSLVKVIQVYADDHNTGNVTKTVSNLAFGWFGKSDWSVAKAQLQPLARLAIANHFQVLGEPEKQKLKADALSEFLLRYLVTQECRIHGKSYRLIPDNEWERYHMDKISIEEIIERAIHGNGYHLAEHRISDLLQLINKEKHLMRRRVQETERKFKGIESIDEWVVEISEVEDLNDIYVYEVQALLDEYLAAAGKVDPFEAQNSVTFEGDRQTLSNNLFELRLMLQIFESIEKIWSRLIWCKPERGKERELAREAFLCLMKFAFFRLRVWLGLLYTLECDLENEMLLWPGTSMFIDGSRHLSRELEGEVGNLMRSVEKDVGQTKWIERESELSRGLDLENLRQSVQQLFSRLRECQSMRDRVYSALKARHQRKSEQNRPPPRSLEDSVFISSIDESLYLEMARFHD